MKKVYISGPMRGKKYYNIMAFFEANSKLEELGFTTFNPAKIDAENGANYFALPADYDWDSLPEGFDFKTCRLRDIKELEECDGIYMLRGWENSAGAKAEYYYALWAGKDVMWEDPEEKSNVFSSGPLKEDDKPSVEVGGWKLHDGVVDEDAVPEVSVYMWEGKPVSKEQYYENLRKELEKPQKLYMNLKLEDNYPKDNKFVPEIALIKGNCFYKDGTIEDDKPSKGFEECEPDIPPPLPEDSAKRKEYPLYRGLFKYFPHALCAIAHHSYKNNEKHNPGEELHWSRGKSDDHRDAEMRHELEDDWVAHGWRALAILQLHLEGKLKD